MARWTDRPVVTDLADNDTVLMADQSQAVGERDRQVTLAQLRTFLGAGVTVGVTQASHGLSVGDAVRHNGTSYVAATADTASNAEAVGVVTSVPDANSFAYQTAGHVSGLSGLTAGELYYLQDDGSLDTTAGTVEKPILIATSATTGVLILAISGAGGGGGATWGGIGGDLEDQADLAAELGARPTSSTVTAIEAMTQADYDALPSKDPATLYVITDA